MVAAARTPGMPANRLTRRPDSDLNGHALLARGTTPGTPGHKPFHDHEEDFWGYVSGMFRDLDELASPARIAGGGAGLVGYGA
jgi:hypothetical protein